MSLRAGLAMTLAAGLSACAAPTHFMGIDLTQAPAFYPEDGAMARAQEAIEESIDKLVLRGCLTPSGSRSPAASSQPCAAGFAELETRMAPLRTRAVTGFTDMPLVPLARRAQAGDRPALLELGIRFEEGRGVEQDLGRARSLYRRAASASGGMTAIYIPGVNGQPGHVMPLDLGPVQHGLPEARLRLEQLDARLAAARAD